ncbi:hypothetical protein A2U01_0036022, partial [Trifolium medium]|nr:hypothetical protein [Trifolium medium]
MGTNDIHNRPVQLGMSICIRQSGSPRGLPGLELRKQGFFFRGDGDE